ncbi:MAG: hypothetical protein GX606_06765, partial [Elusimicrobia bacterium]|nr:hypothetical protein [Elusimicrobiota bacterium]
MGKVISNEADLAAVLRRIEEKVDVLDRKMEAMASHVISRLGSPGLGAPAPATGPVRPHDPVPGVNRTPPPARGESRPVSVPEPRVRPTYQIVCADCQQPSEVPFKPTGDRP